MNESINSWADLISYLPLAITVAPYLIWLVAFRSAYVSQSGNRGIWLLILGISLFTFPLFGAIVYYMFRNSPKLADLPQGRTLSEFMQSARQMHDRKTEESPAPEVGPEVTVNDVADIQTPVVHLDPNDFSTHVPPLPDKPSDKYEVLK